MARQLSTEEEWGTCTGWSHPHNGYYAGEFLPIGVAAAVSYMADPARLDE